MKIRLYHVRTYNKGPDLNLPPKSNICSYAPVYSIFYIHQFSKSACH